LSRAIIGNPGDDLPVLSVCFDGWRPPEVRDEDVDLVYRTRQSQLALAAQRQASNAVLLNDVCFEGTFVRGNDPNTRFLERIVTFSESVSREVDHRFYLCDQFTLLLPPVRMIDCSLQNSRIHDFQMVKDAASALEVGHRGTRTTHEAHFIESVLANEMQRRDGVAVPGAEVE
jgi:hypothetical protein